MRRMTLAALTLTASAAALIAAPSAGATTFNNDTPIIFPLGSPVPKPADPYPSSITVSGTAGPITDVNVGFDGITHTSPDDFSIVLVSPSGRALNLMGCIGGVTDVVGVYVTLDDGAPQLPSTGGMSSGTFRPTSHCAATRSFPEPGPLSQYENPGPGLAGTATFASTFNGQSPIGTWRLFVADYFPGDTGSIPGGWSLDIKPDVTPPAPPPAAPGLTCGTGTVQSGTQCVAQQQQKKKKKKKKKKKRKKK